MKHIIVFFLFTGYVAIAQEYPLNDPRNPNCPCHKAQKLAEKEYSQKQYKPKQVVQNKRDKKKRIRKWKMKPIFVMHYPVRRKLTAVDYCWRH